MINLIYGSKGSGKTKRIIDAANSKEQTGNGSVIYITDNSKHSLEIDKSIRFIDSNDFEFRSEETFIGFIDGLLASNNDLTDIYIDGIARIIKKDVAEMDRLFAGIESSIADLDVALTFTISAAELPRFLKKYV